MYKVAEVEFCPDETKTVVCSYMRGILTVALYVIAVKAPLDHVTTIETTIIDV